MEINLNSKNDVTALADPAPYCRLVGSLIYLSLTRPDIAYDVQIVNKFFASPCQLHMSAVFELLDIFVELLIVDYSSHSVPTFSFVPLLMLTRLVLLILADQLLGGVYFLVILFFHGNVRNNLQFPSPLPKLNTEYVFYL